MLNALVQVGVSAGSYLTQKYGQDPVRYLVNPLEVYMSYYMLFSEGNINKSELLAVNAFKKMIARLLFTR